jgi:hypothetical protein
MVATLLLSLFAAGFRSSEGTGTTPLWYYLAIVPFPIAAWCMNHEANRAAIWHLALTVWAILTFPADLWAVNLFAPVLVSTLGIHFARHWTEAATCSPLLRDVQQRLRREWRLPIMIVGAVPSILGFVAIALDQWVLALLLLGILCLIQSAIALSISGGRPLRSLCASVRSWTTLENHDRSIPGLWSSPAGDAWARLAITLCPVVVVAMACEGNQARLFAATATFDPAAMFPIETDPAWSQFVSFAISLLAMAFLSVGAVITLMWPIICDAERSCRKSFAPSDWNALVHNIQHSPDPVESSSYYSGRVASDGSALLTPRIVFNEHGHFAGDAGSGKTSLGLAPWLEQTINFGDSSVVVIDHKGDTLELLATVTAAEDTYFQRTGRHIPIKYFSNQSSVNSYAFNALAQPYWAGLDPYDKTDLLCGAMGLTYGKDYGEGWYTEANAAVTHHAIKAHPQVSSIAELAMRVRETLDGPKKRELHQELRSSGVHVLALLDRLAACQALNVVRGSHFPESVCTEAINLPDLFTQPQILYFHLPVTISAGSAPEISRLLAYSLMCAATKSKRDNQVYLVVDEFQIMAAHNIAYMLQLARSLDIGVILANQSLEDLGELRSAVEANCRYRQWFSVSSLEDMERLVRHSGQTVETFVSESHKITLFGESPTSMSVSESVMPRLSANDLLLAGDHPKRSIIKLTRGEGYFQCGGMPLVVESDFHISKEEYQRRKAFPWPDARPGTFVPRDFPQPNALPPLRPGGPIIETEILGDFGLGGPPRLPKPGKSPGRKRPNEGAPE